MIYVFVTTFQKVCNYKLFITSWGRVIVPRNPTIKFNSSSCLSVDLMLRPWLIISYDWSWS